MNLILSLFAIALASAPALAVESTNEVGLGHTTNANLSSSNTKSDQFLRLSTANVWPKPDGRFRLRLAYEDYFKENINDSFSWNVSKLWKTVTGFRGWTVLGSVFGRHYTHNSPGSTDESFSHIGAGARAEHKDPLGRGMALIWGPSVEVRQYIEGSHRLDNSAMANAMVEFAPKDGWEFDVFANAGALISSQSAFSRLTIEGGAGANYALDSQWDWNNEVMLRRSHFLNRDVSTETVTTRSRGQNVRVRSVSTRETYTTFTLSTQLNRTLDKAWRVGGELNWISQSSESGFQNFSAMEFYGRLIWIF